MTTYAIDIDVKRIDNPSVTDTITLKFKSRAKTLPGLMARAYYRYRAWLSVAGDYMPAHGPDFIPYRLTRVYDFDRDRFTYGCAPVCDIFGNVTSPF